MAPTCGKWSIIDSSEGRTVVYENLLTGAVFECGTEAPVTPTFVLVEWIQSEGDPGDAVFVNGEFYTQLKGNTQCQPSKFLA